MDLSSSQGVANLIAAAGAIVAVLAVVASLVVPRISASLTHRAQERHQERATKLFIFGQLMQHRHSYVSAESVQALNLIDLAFHDDRGVRRAWHEYHQMLSNQQIPAAHPIAHALLRQKKAELLEKMAISLGYKDALNTLDIGRIYLPTWLGHEEELRGLRRRADLIELRRAFNLATDDLEPPPAPPPANSPPAAQQ